MTSYRELYFYLFGEMAAAVEELEQDRAKEAMDRLIHAQQEAEERVMRQDSVT